ncbi:hypothetical protein T03_17076 [Trichinella britovi]|uniref:Uncharacterized protein n=1 Tax=Trichinella britovi TaxID=45882 RepID=A0A0V1C6W0_TRIBR|nr:hypothetical protein T03_17076 [Trichinella britovi]
MVLNVLILCACSPELRVFNTCSSDVQFSREQIVDQLPSSSSWHAAAEGQLLHIRANKSSIHFTQLLWNKWPLNFGILLLSIHGLSPETA